MSLKLLFKEQNMTCIGQHAPLLKVELFSKFLNGISPRSGARPALPPTAKHSEAHYNREQLCLHCSQNNPASLGLDTWARHRVGSESLGEDTCSETFNKMIKRHSKQRLRKGNCFTLLSDRPGKIILYRSFADFHISGKQEHGGLGIWRTSAPSPPWANARNIPPEDRGEIRLCGEVLRLQQHRQAHL